MNEILIGKNLTTNADMLLSMPTVAVVAGDKLSGKTFFIRKLIERKEDGRIIVLTNKPDSYHGLGESFVRLSKDDAKINVSGHLTIVDGCMLYDDDPNHILDNEIRSFGEGIQENDMVIVDEAYPYLADEVNKYELLKTIEEAWKRGATIIVTTNQTALLMEEAERLIEMCEYLICLKQNEKNAVNLCELFASDRGRYELEQIYNLMEFGKGLMLRRDGDISFIEIG